MAQLFTTDGQPPLERHRFWQNAIGETYFHLNLQFKDPANFEGNLMSWELGNVSLSRLESSALCYQRLRQHLHQADDAAEQFLVTMPERETVHFSQQGRTVECGPGGFILERSDEPYEFSYAKDNAMWVMKVPGQALRARLRAPDYYCALQLDSSRGVGKLFSEYVRLLATHLDDTQSLTQPILGQQLIDLLAAAIEADPRILNSQESAVRMAHLRRVEHYVRQHISESDLSPDRIAAACHISTRYLHVLFKDTGQTVTQWLKEQRLKGAYASLQSMPASYSVAAIAYQWGFSDQSQFCRSFKQAFGCAPREVRGERKA